MSKIDQLSNERLQKIVDMYNTSGRDETLINFELSDETLNRYLREAKKRDLLINNKSKIITKILYTYTDKELEAISNGGRIVPGMKKVPIISFEGERIRIGIITDTHIGSTQFSEQRLFQAFEEFKKEKVDFIVHAGDVTEGMSNRPGHIYELDQLGYANQKSYAIKLFSQWSDTEIYAIDGNHDRWYIKSSGANIVNDIADSIPNFNFIGHDEGDISLKGKAVLKLWHGEDGNSYALSYRLQKIVESLSGGEKPHVLIAGHTHKYVKMWDRNVWVLSSGSIQAQTQWMRSKRIAAHVGFDIADIWVNDSGVCKFRETWYPFYT